MVQRVQCLTPSSDQSCAPERVAGIDPSPAFLDSARRRLAGAAEFRQADVRGLPFDAAEFDRVVSALVLNFVPDQPRAAAEMVRVVRPGGEVAVYVWDYAGRMELMRYFWDAAAAWDARGAELEEGKRFPICRPGALQQLCAAAGLAEVETRAVDVPTVFNDFDDYWSPFLGGPGPAPGYCALPEEHRARLRERLRASLPMQSDGSIHLIARA